MPAAPINVFISYSHNEEDRTLLDKLVSHLASLHSSDPPLIRIWDDSHLLPGDPWDEEIKEYLGRADIVLLLISADFNNSRYIREVEMTEAIARHRRGKCRVAPILLRPCYFEGMVYADLEILPKHPADQRLEPVVNRGKWLTEDFALTEVTRRLRELVEEIKSQVRRPVAPVASQGPPSLSPWQSFFSLHPPTKQVKLLDTVNCDRGVHFENQLKSHFEENKEKPGNILYLITACETQKPTGLARRLAYWFDEDCALFFRPGEDAKKDELAFHDLPLEKKPEQTFGNFWRLMQDHILHAPVEFDEFVQNPDRYLALPVNTRALLSFQISEFDFKEYDAVKHISYLLERLSSLPTEFQKFIFCFVLHFPGIHDVQRQESADILMGLDNFVAPAAANAGWNAGLHVSCLPPVAQDDLRVWWAGRFDYHGFTDAVEKLISDTPPGRREACRRDAHFDMETIEDMQYAAYVFYRDQY